MFGKPLSVLVLLYSYLCMPIGPLLDALSLPFLTPKLQSLRYESFFATRTTLPTAPRRRNFGLQLQSGDYRDGDQ